MYYFFQLSMSFLKNNFSYRFISDGFVLEIKCIIESDKMN